MKNIKVLHCFLVTFLLTSCGGNISDSQTNTSETTNETTSVVDSSSSSSSFDTTSENEEPIKFSVIGINDFHGSVNEKISSYGYYEYGLGKLSTFIKNERNEQTSFVISSGDMWQGSIESNENRGKFVTEAMNLMGFDSMTLGNHEFDWGTEIIQSNAELANFPILAANIIDEKDKLSNIKSSALIEKDNVKVGVIGIIGSSVYSSITATMTEDLIFDEESKYVIEESEKLREKGANFIILSIHLGAADFSSNLIKSIVSSDIDLVLAGHNHREEVEEFYDNDFNVIPVLNAICNGEAFSKVEVQFDPKNQECEILNYDVYSFDDAEYTSLEEDPEIYELYKSKYDVDDLKNEVIGQANGYFTSTSNLPVMAAQAMYEKVNEDFAQYDIKGSVHNQARANLESGEILYEDIYTSFPFENEILIVEADKDYIYDLASTSNRYFNIGFDVNDISDETFYFAGIDYVILKDFDTSECIKTGLFIRDVIVDYIKKVGTINSSDYY